MILIRLFTIFLALGLGGSFACVGTNPNSNTPQDGDDAGAGDEMSSDLDDGDFLSGDDDAGDSGAGDLDTGDTDAGDGGSGGGFSGPGELCVYPTDTLYFPGTVIGSPADTSAFSFGTIYVRNCGGETLNITGLGIDAGSDSEFSISFFPYSGDSTTLVAGESMGVELQFTPQAVGSDYSGSLSVHYGSGDTHTVSLVGAGIADDGECIIQVGPTLVGSTNATTSRYDMGLVAVGDEARENFTISNISRNPCTITGISLNDGGDTFYFRYPSQVETPFQLSFRQIKIIDVGFLPSTVSGYGATITVTSDDGLASTRVMELLGEGL